MPIEDKQLRRRAERVVHRHPLDISRLHIRASGDTIHLEGRIRLMRGSAGAKDSDINNVMLAIEEEMRGIPTVRNVVMTMLVLDR